MGAGLPEAERLAGGDDDHGVMEQAIEQRGGSGLDRQEAPPLLEGPVAGDPEAAALVGGGTELSIPRGSLLLTENRIVPGA